MGPRTGKVQMASAHVMPAPPIPIDAAGLKIMLTPAASASVHSLHCSARIAAWPATMPLEHAVSNETHGPSIPSANETRPATTEHVAADAANTLSPAGLLESTSTYSHAHTPTYTPVPSPSAPACAAPRRAAPRSRARAAAAAAGPSPPPPPPRCQRSRCRTTERRGGSRRGASKEQFSPSLTSARSAPSECPAPAQTCRSRRQTAARCIWRRGHTAAARTGSKRRPRSQPLPAQQRRGRTSL